MPEARGRGPAPLALVVYGTLTVVTLGIALARAKNPVFTDQAWVSFGGPIGHGVSLAFGVLLAAATIAATRFFVRRFGWARRLHGDLRPSIRYAGDATIVILGVASAVAEELFFRGFLATVCGLVVSSLAFGALHQLKGRVRWAWAGWATVMGLLFGALFLATGSLAGPVVAHAAINVANLRFLRDTDIDPPKPKKLGGLLAR